MRTGAGKGHSISYSPSALRNTRQRPLAGDVVVAKDGEVVGSEEENQADDDRQIGPPNEGDLLGYLGALVYGADGQADVEPPRPPVLIVVGGAPFR